MRTTSILLTKQPILGRSSMVVVYCFFFFSILAEFEIIVFIPFNVLVASANHRLEERKKNPLRTSETNKQCMLLL